MVPARWRRPAGAASRTYSWTTWTCTWWVAWGGGGEGREEEEEWWQGRLEGKGVKDDRGERVLQGC
jgi:hypothetical protein